MSAPPLRSKVLSLADGELWIDTLVRGTISDSDPLSFPASTIAETGGFGPKYSFIKLQSGREMFFNLPFETLQKKMKEAEGGHLDLGEHASLKSRAEIKNDHDRALKEKFEEEARRRAGLDRRGVVDSITYTVWARSRGQDDFREYTFSGHDIIFDKISENSSHMGGQNISLFLKDPSSSPFLDGEFILEMTQRQFMHLSEDAYMALQKDIDLRAETSKKGLQFPAAARKNTAPAP